MKVTVTLWIVIGFSLFLEANNSVIDSQTNLEWQDNNESNSTKITWKDAINYCENLNLDRKSDWRLPNKNELLSIVDYNRENPAIKDIFTYYTINNYYWSSTTPLQSPHYVWMVSFGYGISFYSHKSDSLYVRCVRGGE